MPSYIRPAPPHSGLTALFGGNSTTGEYYHLTPQEYAFIGPLSSGVTSVTATTFYSGASELGSLFSNALVTIIPGVNAYTGASALGRVVGVIGNPVFSSVTSDSVSANTVWFDGSLADSATGNTEQYFYYKNNGLVQTNPIMHYSSDDNSVFADALYAVSLSAQTIYFGNLDITTLFATQELANTYLSKSGGTGGPYIFTGLTSIIGNVVLGSITGTTTSIIGRTAFHNDVVSIHNTIPSSSVLFKDEGVLQVMTGDSSFSYDRTTSGLTVVNVSGSTFFSGGTELGQLLDGIATYVQPGANIATGGTASRPVVHVVGSPVFTGVTASSVSGTSMSATTFFSGGTELGSLFAPASVVATYVQPGANIATGGTPSNPIVSLSSTININRLIFSGEVTDNFSTTSVNGVYYKNQSNALTNSIRFTYDESTGLVAESSASDTGGFYTQLGGLTGQTLYSGSTNIQDLFAPASVVATYVQPGANAYTAGTASNPIIGVVGSPVFTGVTASSVSGTSMSATTFYSGTTELGSLLAGAAQLNDGGISFSMDGGASVISTGQKGYLIAPYSGTINSWTIISHETGSIVVDVWKAPYADFPPTVANTIAGSEKPTLSSQNKNQDNDLTTWTTSFNSGDIFTINVDSVSTVKKVTLILNTTKLS